MTGTPRRSSARRRPALRAAREPTRTAAAPPPAESPPAASPSRYTQATSDLRSTAKWLLGVLAAVAAALLAGLQLTRLGELHGQWIRLAVALTAAGAALAAVGYMIAATSRVFTDQWVTLADLDDSAFDQKLSRGGGAETAVYDLLRAEIDQDRQWLYRHVAEDIPALHRMLRQGNDAARTARAAASAGGAGQLDVVRAAAAAVADCANYHHTRLILRRLRRKLAWASVVVVVGILAFAYAANPPADPSGPLKVEITPPAGR
jgi:hypothetical protein